jgi:hypothetical protein
MSSRQERPRVAHSMPCSIFLMEEKGHSAPMPRMPSNLIKPTRHSGRREVQSPGRPVSRARPREADLLSFANPAGGLCSAHRSAYLLSFADPARRAAQLSRPPKPHLLSFFFFPGRAGAKCPPALDVAARSQWSRACSLWESIPMSDFEKAANAKSRSTHFDRRNPLSFKACLSCSGFRLSATCSLFLTGQKNSTTCAKLRHRSLNPQSAIRSPQCEPPGRCFQAYLQTTAPSLNSLPRRRAYGKSSAMRLNRKSKIVSMSRRTPSE